MSENKSETKSQKETKTTSTVRIIELLERLGEPLPEEAVQRTKKEKTHKSYDTDGYGYQYCVDRFNNVLGEKWGFSWEILKEIQGKYSQSGKGFFDITAKVSIWVNNEQNSRAAVGGHIALLYADALKGAITNAFKKTAAFWGVGRQAYLGLLDDDNKPLPEEAANGKQQPKTSSPKQSQPQSQLPSPLNGKTPNTYDKDSTNNDATDKFGKTLRQYRNELTVLPMFIAKERDVDNLSTPGGLKIEAEEIYKLAAPFKPYFKPDSPKLTVGRATAIFIHLRDMIHNDCKMRVQDAIDWWNSLDENYIDKYVWWKVETFKETVQSPF